MNILYHDETPSMDENTIIDQLEELIKSFGVPLKIS